MRFTERQIAWSLQKTGGGASNLSIKSGTNQYQINVFEFIRNKFFF